MTSPVFWPVRPTTDEDAGRLRRAALRFARDYGVGHEPDGEPDDVLAEIYYWTEFRRAHYGSRDRIARAWAGRYARALRMPNRVGLGIAYGSVGFWS